LRVLNILYSTAHHLIAHHLSGGQLSNYFSHESNQRNKKTTSFYTDGFGQLIKKHTLAAT